MWKQHTSHWSWTDILSYVGLQQYDIKAAKKGRSQGAVNIDQAAGQKHYMTPEMIPIIDAADLDVLLSFVEVSDKTQSTDIFASSMLYATDYFMREIGNNVLLFMFVPWCCFVAMFTIAVYAFVPLVEENPDKDTNYMVGWVLQGLVLIGVFFDSMIEVVRFWSKRNLYSRRVALIGSTYSEPYNLYDHIANIW